MHQGTGDGHTLLLPTRELRGPVLHPVPQPYLIQHLAGTFLCIASGLSLDQQRHAHILHAGQRGDEIEGLEDEANGLRAKLGRPSLAHAQQVLTEDGYLTGTIIAA